MIGLMQLGMLVHLIKSESETISRESESEKKLLPEVVNSIDDWVDATGKVCSFDHRCIRGN